MMLLQKKLSNIKYVILLFSSILMVSCNKLYFCITTIFFGSNLISQDDTAEFDYSNSIDSKIR